MVFFLKLTFNKQVGLAFKFYSQKATNYCEFTVKDLINTWQDMSGVRTQSQTWMWNSYGIWSYIYYLSRHFLIKRPRMTHQRLSLPWDSYLKCLVSQPKHPERYRCRWHWQPYTTYAENLLQEGCPWLWGSTQDFCNFCAFLYSKSICRGRTWAWACKIHCTWKRHLIWKLCVQPNILLFATYVHLYLFSLLSLWNSSPWLIAL